MSLPAFSDSSNGWGPSSSSLPLHLLGLPFMPFNKGEKLSKIYEKLWGPVPPGA